MAHQPVSRTRIAALILSCVGLALAASSIRLAAQPMAQSGVVPASAENPSDALSRHLRQLAATPRNFQALIGAGRAALSLGDTQAAAGFFGRADEVWPSSPLPHIGMGAAAAQDGESAEALAHFNRAARLGGSGVTMGAHRGLAYDLVGRHDDAQTDYRAALAGTEADEARRRLALSLGITGRKQEALDTLAPLLSRRDPAAVRTRALVLAVTGDQAGAQQAIEASMPGGWAQMGPFLARLGGLSSADKAAAVHLGIFPRAGYSAPSRGTAVASVQQNRLAEIETLIQGTPPVQRPPPPARAQPQTTAPPAVARSAASAASAATTVVSRKRFWVQLASGPTSGALPAQFQRIKARSDKMLDGINGYVVEEGSKARLLVGPFKDVNDARIFAENLETVSISAFSWTSAEGQLIRKITSE